MVPKDSFLADDNLKRFSTLNVAILDEDAKSAQMTRTLLSSLGVYQFRIVRDAMELQDTLKDKPADVLVADLGNKTDAELEAIYNLRRDASGIAFTPVIALSPQTTVADVRRILDAGATEIVAKPSNVKSVYSRLQCLIDSPRSFVATKEFRGPDRRRKTNAKSEGETRQSRSPIIVDKADYVSGDIGNQPVIIMPDFSLKLKVSSVLSHTMKPQLENEFLFWVLSDIAVLELALVKLVEGGANMSLIERICNACLSIKARASIYDYAFGAKVAGLLSDFCRNYYNPTQAAHVIVIEKHIQVLSIIFHQKLHGNGGSQGQELLTDLAELVKKYVEK